MTTQDVANRLVELCRQGKFEDAVKELYGQNIVSIEPAGTPGPQEVSGLDKVIAKGMQFAKMTEEVHGMEVSDPLVTDTHFTCKMTIDITYKGMPRSKESEICVYEVQDGKIVKEQFFFFVPQEA